MLEQISPLWDVFIKSKESNQSLVMATIVNTIGSSYKKKGAMVLIDENLIPYGLISGGCLENDLAEHAESVFKDKKAILLDYDLSDDSIFGLGAGCDGSIQVILQILNPENNYQPFSLLNPIIDQATDTTLYLNFNQSSELFSDFQLISNQTKKYSSVTIEADHLLNPDSYCRIELNAPLKIAIVGTGVDIIPICKQIEFMHWHGYILDHRNSRLHAYSSFKNINPLSINLNDLDQVIDLPRTFDAVILVTHNIDRDAQYLGYFNHFKIPYIGLLGPINRRDKVLKKAGLKLEQLNNDLYAPIGLDIACNSPEHIALSIIAEIQLKLNNYRTTLV